MQKNIKELISNKNYRNNQNYSLNFNASKKIITIVISNWLRISQKYWYKYFSIGDKLQDNKWLFLFIFTIFWFYWIIYSFKWYDSIYEKIIMSFIILFWIYLFLFVSRLIYKIVIYLRLREVLILRDKNIIYFKK